jgi:Family of unknown function (DUF5522)
MCENTNSSKILYKIIRISTKDPFFEKIMQRHKEAIANDDDMYGDPETGYSVFTAKYLLKRGTCCNNGCRHCPYKK